MIMIQEMLGGESQRIINALMLKYMTLYYVCTLIYCVLLFVVVWQQCV